MPWQNLEPRKDFYVRKNSLDELSGPYDFRQAVHAARFLSKNEDNIEGTAEIITIVGTRRGDPPSAPPITEVKYLYVRGRCLFGSSLAGYNSRRYIGLR